MTAFIGDEDYLVRLQAAKRLPHGQLRRMVNDDDREVRKEVARRLPTFALGLMAKDEDAEVRRIVAARMLSDDAATDAGGRRLGCASGSVADLHRLKKSPNWWTMSSRMCAPQCRQRLNDFLRRRRQNEHLHA